MAVTELDIRVTSSVSAVADDFDEVARSADRMGDSVKRAGVDADTASSRMDSVAASADNMDDKAGRATGALGALSSGFELVGAEKYAAGLQGAALATDFFSGIGQSLNLVMESQIVVTAKAKAAWVAQKAAMVAQAIAAKTTAAAQWLLNAAMSANPVGLIIAAVLVLVGLLVLLFRRNEKFRAIVVAVMKAAAAAVGWVVRAVGRLVSWVADKATAAWKVLSKVAGTVLKAVVRFVVSAVTTYVRIWARILSFGVQVFNRLREAVARIITRIVEVFGRIADKAREVWEKVTSGFRNVRDNLSTIASTIREKISGAFEAAKAPIQWVVDKIEWLLSHGGKLLGMLPGVGRTTATSGKAAATAGTLPAGRTAGETSYTFNFPSLVTTSTDDLVALILQALDDRERRLGYAG